MKISLKLAIITFLCFNFFSRPLVPQSTGIIGDSTINRCEIKSYTISIQNNSGNLLTNLAIVVKLENLTGFSYVTGTTSIDVNGGGAFCTANPVISGGYTGSCAPAPPIPIRKRIKPHDISNLRFIPQSPPCRL